jgi:hypothetical protein
MPGGRPLSFFTCANCGALYQVVRDEAGTETVSRKRTCRYCDTALPGRDGRYVLKYFHLRDGDRRWEKGKGR